MFLRCDPQAKIPVHCFRRSNLQQRKDKRLHLIIYHISCCVTFIMYHTSHIVQQLHRLYNIDYIVHHVMSYTYHIVYIV